MEKEKKTFKQDTRKTQIGSNGGGNIGGLLLLGGALAVGSLVATLAAHKGSRRRNSDDKSSRSRPKEDQPSQGLHFILQTSSPTFHGNQCCASNGSTELNTTQIEPSKLISTHSLLLEENPSAINSSHENADNCNQEILLIHHSKQDTTDMCKNHCSVEEFPLPDKDAKNDVAEETKLMATIEVPEEDAIDTVKVSIEEIQSVQSTDEEDDDDKKEKEQAKEKLLLEENIEVEEVEEPIAVKTCAEKTSLNSVEEDNGNNSRKGSPAMEITEVKQEEEATDEVEEEDTIDAVKINLEEISSVQSTEEEEEEEEEDNDDEKEKKQAKEKLLPEGEIGVVEEEKPIAVKTRGGKTTLNSVQEDDEDDNFGKGSPFMDITEVQQEPINETAEEDAIDAVKLSIDENSSVQSTEEDDNDDEDKKHPIDAKEDGDDNDEMSDDEHVLKKSQESPGGTGNSSTGSDADEIWPAESVEALTQELMNTMINSRLSAAKTTEQDENNKTEFNYFNNSKNNGINCSRDIDQTRGNSAFTKEEENLEFKVWNQQPTTYSRKWTISIEHILIMASIVLLFLTYCNALSYLSSS